MSAEAIIYTSKQLVRLNAMEKEKPSPNALLTSLSEGNMAVLDQLYDTYRDDFIRWACQRFQGINRDDILDAWHDTMIMFYEQVRDKKLTNLTCEIKTFLFTIGYRRLLRMHKKSERIDLVEAFDANINIDQSINVSESEEMAEEQQIILMAAIRELPEKSRQILVMRFMEGKSIPQIMQEMKYANENTVSVTLSRGLKKLKEMISERMATQQE